MDKGVELLLGLLILVSLSCDSDAHFTGDVPDASGPDLSVEQWVDAHLLHTAKSTFDKVLLHLSISSKNSTALATLENRGFIIGAVRAEPNRLLSERVTFQSNEFASEASGCMGVVHGGRLIWFNLHWCASPSG